MLTRNAISDPSGKSENNRPIATNNGVPGGCGTPMMYDVAINSPQSQKAAVGATLYQYTMKTTREVAEKSSSLILFSVISRPP
jgi:hypothetical protein